ncbi:hypothetical protein HPP92_027107 [Vanilla planifolia]|uniref:Uncharacterized protein n=1 Tax=Vanilla planifolia TaxID=51239 RepID=A0A835P9T5_VANPL|nr:hypothetical protein HPP92_027107 [Vanilla planifolia]
MEHAARNAWNGLLLEPSSNVGRHGLLPLAKQGLRIKKGLSRRRNEGSSRKKKCRSFQGRSTWEEIAFKKLGEQEMLESGKG